MHFNSCKIEIDFEFGSCHGDLMTVEIINGNHVETIDPNNPTYKSEIYLPTRLEIRTSGKRMDYHTRLENGEIVEDMYVKIQNVRLDGLPLNQNFLNKKITLVDENKQSHTTNYFGFNGSVNLNFDEDNVFIQYVLLNT